jgi:hypothetical protein
MSDVTVVFIRVTDVNDNAPEVTYPTSADNTVHIRRMTDIRAGSTVAIVTARDRDAGPNAALTYSIVAGDLRRRFDIGQTTGRIRWRHDVNSTKWSLSGECSWSLTVLVQDGGLVNPLSAKARLDVVVDGCETVSGGEESQTSRRTGNGSGRPLFPGGCREF